MAAALRIWLLGRFAAQLADRPVLEEAWHGGRAKAVVKLLALAPGHRLHREQVMDALWPDLAPGPGAANLRKAVHYARRATSPQALLSCGEVLVAEAWVDVDAFEAAADVGDAQAALDLYAGELLPEDRFAPWAEDCRRRLQERCERLCRSGPASWPRTVNQTARRRCSNARSVSIRWTSERSAS